MFIGDGKTSVLNLCVLPVWACVGARVGVCAGAAYREKMHKNMNGEGSSAIVAD